jgi:hypothetical protein
MSDKKLENKGTFWNKVYQFILKDTAFDPELNK